MTIGGPASSLVAAGAFTGVVLLGLVQNLLVLSQVDTFWISAADGAIILAALLLARFVEGAGK